MHDRLDIGSGLLHIVGYFFRDSEYNRISEGSLPEFFFVFIHTRSQLSQASYSNDQAGTLPFILSNVGYWYEINSFIFWFCD